MLDSINPNVVTLINLIESKPGQTKRWYALEIGIGQNNIDALLAAVESVGYLVCESDFGGRLLPPRLWRNASMSELEKMFGKTF